MQPFKREMKLENKPHNAFQRKSKSKKEEEEEEGFGGGGAVVEGIYPAPFVYKINDGCTGGGGGASGWKLLHEVCAERGWREMGYDEWGRGESGGGGAGNYYYGGRCNSTSTRRNSSSADDDTNSTTSSSDWSSSGGGGDDQVGGLMEWNFWWRTHTMRSGWRMRLYPWQVTNHFRNWSNFSRKDYLARYLRRMEQNHGSIYSFSPMCFHLPLDYTRLCYEHSRRSRLSGSLAEGGTRVCPVWICKPVGKSQGRGIQVFNTVTALSYDTACVVQEYVMRPYLIGGYKWDLRIYVCIVRMSPPVVYAYREGLARFATKKYMLKSPFDPFVHLTNTTINKHGPNYGDCKDVVGLGCKWTLGKLRRYFEEKGDEDWLLWQKIVVILVLTVIGETAAIHAKVGDDGNNYFELLGFDIIVDEMLKPILLEVNTNPSLGNDCYVDEVVKRPLLHDLMTLLGLPDARSERKTSMEGGEADTGDWVRIFPFSKDTEQISCMTNKSLKSVVVRIQQFAKLAKTIGKNGELSEAQKDNMLKSCGYFTGGAWHPKYK